MSDLFPLARVDQAIALREGGRFILVVRGYAVGFDGTLAIIRGNEEPYPPIFRVYALPGNCGITGVCPPERLVTVAVAFEEPLDACQLWSAGRRELVRAIPVEAPRVVDLRPAPADQPAPDLDASWHAWVNAMANPPKLIVVGSVLLPTPGWTVTLGEAASPTINPTTLALELTATPPADPAAQVLTRYDVRFERPSFPGEYATVLVLPFNISIPVTTAY